MVDNTRHPKHYPTITSGRPPVDLYITGQSENDTPYSIFDTGLSQPIYSLSGNISRQLPLESWPQENSYHPEIFLMCRRQNQAICTTCKRGNQGTINLWSGY